MCFKTDGSDLKIMRILYVGKSSASLQERFRSEYKTIIGEANPAYFWKDENESRRVKLRRLFSLEPIELWFCRIHSDESTLIDNLETRLIALTNPPGNQQRKLKPIGEPQKIWGY